MIPFPIADECTMPKITTVVKSCETMWNDYGIQIARNRDLRVKHDSLDLQQTKSIEELDNPEITPSPENSLTQLSPNGTEIYVWSTTMTIKDAVVAALENPRYLWRTVDGIAREINATPDEVLEQLSHLGNILAQPSRLSSDNRNLYTTRVHFRKTAPFLTKLIGAFTNRVA